MLKLFRAIIIFIILSFITPVNAAAPNWQLTAKMRTSYFIVHYASDPYLAKLLAEEARDALIRISRDLGQPIDKNRPFPLYVYPTHFGFLQAGGLETSKFTIGTASSGNETISIDASGVFASPDEVLAHEITHAVIFRALGPKLGAIPLWVNEGLAKYESEQFTNKDDSIIADAAGNGILIPLRNLTSQFPKDRNDLAYAESASAIRYFVKKYGKTAPRILISEMARTGSFDKAMYKITGNSSAAFMDKWYAYTTKHYWGMKVARIGTAIISAIMAILVIVAFFVRRKQKIKAAKQWDQEQFEENIRKQLGNDWWR